jgi:hypothetical protein
MSKLINVLVLGVIGLVVLDATGPTITRLISALVPLVLAVGIVVAILRCVWWLTGPR